MQNDVTDICKSGRREQVVEIGLLFNQYRFLLCQRDNEIGVFDRVFNAATRA